MASAILLGALAAPTVFGAEATAVDSLPVLIDPVQIWSIPQEQKSVAHPIKLEGRVSYFDPEWRLFWLEQNNVGTYVLLGDNPPDLRMGQRVVLEGHIIPDKGLSADLATVRVLQDFEPVQPVPTKGRIGDMTAFHGRVVRSDGFVESQQSIDDNHLRLSLIVEDRPVIVWIKPDNPRSVPNWGKKFIEVTGMYSGRFDPTGTETTIELWVGLEASVKVVGALNDHPLFASPATAINRLFQVPVGTEIRVQGTVESHEGGSHLQVRDGTGQVFVYSIQQQRLPPGTIVDVIGRVAIEGSKWVLRSGLYRKAAVPALTSAMTQSAFNAPIERVAELRQLSLDDAARGRPVKFSGLVTWSMPGRDFFFLQDVSGGVRVRFDPSNMPTPQLGKYLQVEGVSYNGGFVPAVDLRAVTDLGSMSPPAAKPVTVDQAITGSEDGQWVEIRGFMQRTESNGDARRIHVTTPSGEFVGNLESPVNFVANPGSLIRVRGVCEATSDADGRLTGVMLRVPFLHSITIEEDAPSDYFDLPLRSVKGLRQLSSLREMTRVRVSGTVLHCTPGKSLYLEEGDAGLMMFTRQTTPVAPGTKVEAVGILGREGVRIVLREVAFKEIAAGPPPVPVEMNEPARLMPELDARLVKVRGTVIDAAHQRDRSRLTLQSGTMLFEAHLDHAAQSENLSAPVGAGLELTGIYELEFDDSRQIRNFSLQLRSPADVVTYRTPRLWTVQRAFIVIAVLAGCSLLALGWITALRRRVRKQTRQLREQMERQARLEQEVQHAARLESLGMLAGGIAHDFNNLLTIILGNLGLAMFDDKLTDSTTHALQEIERGARRARALTQQLLTFSKGGDPIRSVLSLDELVKDTADAALQSSPVRCEYRVASNLWRANVDREQIVQAVQNLAINAKEAMPRGGVLKIELNNEIISSGVETSLAPGRYVKLTITDSGEGISAEELPRIFDPYYSTRKVGSGLGLATVYSIVTKHQGRIEVESNAGEGTIFKLWLPAANPPKEATAPVIVQAPVLTFGKTARVLLMDDEESIREIGTVVLRRMGLEPVVIPDGGSAVREFSMAQTSGNPFDLVILDLTIPGGMGGKEAMELIRKLDPKVPAIVSSGYSSDPVLANFEAYGFQGMVPKPYEVGQLAQMINRLLGRN